MWIRPACTQWAFVLALSATTAWSDDQTSNVAPSDSDDPTIVVASENRPRMVIVKPVILCDDDGSHPAAYALPKQLVDQVYTKAGLEFIYLEPIKWNNGKARRGEINLDQIVREGREGRTISRDPRIVTLVFASAIDGKSNPMGRGRQNGNVCFVTLGPQGADSDPAMQAFVVAHEIGHCLNLIHAVDDPSVPDDVPNLQGSGAFKDRLAVEGLHDTQRDTVLKSPLVIDRLRFHPVDEGRKVIVDESWESYLSEATDDFLRFSIGLKADAPIPQSPEARHQLAEQKFAEKVLEFTDAEETQLAATVERLKELTAKDWPAVSRLPWHFLKVDSSFCSGFAHTRGMTIVLTPRHLQMIARNEGFGLTLLLHEKLHVIQRLNGPRFAKLYERYGFKQIMIAEDELRRVNVAQNPDAFNQNWAIQLGQTPTLMLMVFVNSPSGRLSFSSEYRKLVSQSDGTYAIGETLPKDEKFIEWKDGFRLATGLEHPNEVSAYLSSTLFQIDYLKTTNREISEAQKERLDQTRNAFKEIMQIQSGSR